MPFTEFCCRSGGSNLNAGTRTGSSTEPGTTADLTYASGSWVASTGVFTVASGNPSSDGVAVGDFASVYADGSTVTGFVGRVTARDTTTITVSLTAKAGTAPTDGTGNRTLKIGGSWAGPNAASWFPLTLATLASLTNSSGDPPRINLKNDATYGLTTAATVTCNGPLAIEGYTSAYGDDGRATLSGGTSGASYTVLTFTGTNVLWKSFLFTGNGATGSGIAWWWSSATTRFFDCVFATHRGHPYFANGIIEQCEFYANNIGGGTSAAGGLRMDGGTIRHTCVHDNTNDGIANFGGPIDVVCCVIESNSRHGIHLDEGGGSGSSTRILQSDFYNNTTDGVRIANTSAATKVLENCNFVKNGGYGINGTGSGMRVGVVLNCGFGAGTQVNASGATTGLKAIVESGTVNYASDVTPWVDPANGDFRVSLSTAKGAGRGTFTQTAASYSGTVGYPDIGAAQHQDSGGGGVRMVNIRGGADQ